MIIFAFIVIVSIGIVVTALIYKNRDDVVNEVVVAKSNQRDENKKQGCVKPCPFEKIA